MERVTNAYKSRLAQVCKAAELTPPQFFALMTIARAKRLKMSPLADGLGLSMGAASTLIDRLVTRGLVERDTDAADRRAVYVSLSERGIEVLDSAALARRSIISEVFLHLSADDRAQLIAGFTALANGWDLIPAPPMPEGGFGCGEDHG